MYICICTYTQENDAIHAPDFEVPKLCSTSRISALIVKGSTVRTFRVSAWGSFSSYDTSICIYVYTHIYVCEERERERLIQIDIDVYIYK